MLLAGAHLAAFSIAGHLRLHLPFCDSSESPSFSAAHVAMTRGYPREPRHWSRLIVSRWDAQHYIGTAVRGLTACPHDATVYDVEYLDCGLGWLPAYGETARLVAHTTGLAADVALVVLSFLAAIAINLMWISRTMCERIGRLPAYATLVAFNVFPTAFYVVTPYSEAATIALGLGGFFAIARERWILAGLLVGAATALRIQAASFALALACAAVLAAILRRRAGRTRWWWPLLCVPLVGWGQLIEMLMLKLCTGDAFAFWRARVAFGDVNRMSRLWHPLHFMKAFNAQHMDGVIYVGVIAVIVLTVREVLRRFRPDEAVFLAVASFTTLAIAIVAPLEWWGINRYLLLCPLAFLGAGFMIRRHTALYVMWLVLCALFYWHVELCSYITQGSPHLCPCLGKVEFTLPWAS